MDDSGHAVARITDLHGENADVASHLRELQEKSLARIGSGKIDEEFWDLPLPEDNDGATLKVLLEERGRSQ